MIKFRPLTEQVEWTWMYERAHQIACEDSQGIVAYDDKDEIQAVAVFDSFTVDACSVHFAIDNPMVIRSGFLNEIARHAFITCNRKRIFGLVPSNNERALKLDLHIGFTEVARIPDAIADGIDYIVIRLDKRDCRWLPQEIRQEAA
jgi:hypothetical protein